MSYAQVTDHLIFSFDQFQFNTASFAPAIIDTSSRIQLKLGDRSYKGVYNGVNSRFLQFDYLISPSTHQHHSIGVQVYQSNMGEYIRTNSLYATYAFRLALSPKLELSSGINLGYKSMILDPADVGGGGTSKILASTIGIGLLSKKIKLLIGYKDFLNQDFIFPKFQITSPIVLSTYLGYNIALNQKWHLSFHTLGEFNNINEQNYRFTAITNWNKHLDVGAGHRTDKGTFLMAGLSNLAWQRATFSTNLSYLVIPNLSFQNMPNQVIELTLALGY